MIRLSDQSRKLVWRPFGKQKNLPKKKRARAHFTAATSLDIDLSQVAAEEMARQVVNGGALMAELGLTAKHSANFIQMILAAQENPQASNKVYERFFSGIALAQLKMTKVKGILAPDGSDFDVNNLSHLAALLRDPSRCSEWRGWVLATEIMENQAGNAPSAAPSGSTASAETSVKGAPTSTNPAQKAKAAASTQTAKPAAPDKQKNPKPPKKPLFGKSDASPASGQKTVQG